VFSDAVSRAVLVSAPDGILVVNHEGRIILANSQTEDLLGYGPNEMFELHCAAVLPELFREEYPGQAGGSRSSSLHAQGRVGLELRALCKDGKELRLAVSVCTVDVHDGPLVCCILRKMDAPKQSEQTFHEISEQFRLLVENSNDILTIRNADGRIRYMSPSIRRVLGYKQEEMIGSIGLELIHPDDRSSVEHAMNEFWKNPGARDSVQYRARHANGAWVSLEVVAYNLLDDPNVRGVVISGRNISERKQAEAGQETLSGEIPGSAALPNSLPGLLPICASCKKIKNETGNWQQLEVYFLDRALTQFSHGMCPECAAIWYPQDPQE